MNNYPRRKNPASYNDTRVLAPRKTLEVATIGEAHICDECFGTILSNLPKTPLPYELSDDPDDLAALLAAEIDGDNRLAGKRMNQAKNLILVGVRVLRDTSEPDDRPVPEPAPYPPVGGLLWPPATTSRNPTDSDNE